MKYKISLNVLNDPLVTDFNINQLITNKETNKIFIDSNKTYFNLYGALIKRNDIHVKTKNSFLKRTPYLIDDNASIANEIKNLSEEYTKRDFRKLRRLICNYYFKDKLEKATFLKWFKDKKFPLFVIRLVSEISSNKNLLIQSLSKCHITDVNGFGRIKFKFLLDKFCFPFNFYLAGIAMGDGTMNNIRWKIVDGDPNKKRLFHSKEFLEFIKRKIELNYDTRLTGIYKIKNKNAYELVFGNKWFCRYLNFFFGLPFNKKPNLTFPLILNFFDNKYKKYLIRGLFDTDGSFDKHRVTFASQFQDLIEDLNLNLHKLNIKFSESKMVDQHRKLFKINILTSELKEYAKLIGFNHPKKQKGMIKILKKNTLRKKLMGINKRNILDGQVDLNKIKPKIATNLNFPLFIDKDILKIAKYVRPVKNEGKIRFCNINNKLLKKEIIFSFQRIFSVKVSKNVNSLYAYSKAAELFFDKVFIYDYERNSMENNELKGLKNNWDSI